MLYLADKTLPLVIQSTGPGGPTIPPAILSTLFLASVLVFSHIVSRLIVAELRERRAYRRKVAALRAQRELFNDQHLICDEKEKNVRR